MCSELASFWCLTGQTVTRLPSRQEERCLHVPAFLCDQKKGPVPRVKGRLFGQKTIKMLLTSGCVETVPAPGWHFSRRRVWVFLYLGQDFCAKTHLMNKHLGLPSKPVSFHSRFLQRWKDYFCDSVFVTCLFFLCLLFPSFCSAVMLPLAAGAHSPAAPAGDFHAQNGSPSTQGSYSFLLRVS